MSDNRPVHLGIFQLRDTELTRVSAIGLVIDVLRGNLDLALGQFPDEQEVQRRRGDHHLGVGVEFGGIQVVNDGLDAV